MRFLLYFPLPLLLILGSFVSIDAAPQSVFKPVPPWSTHKPRLKRSIDNMAKEKQQVQEGKDKKEASKRESKLIRNWIRPGSRKLNTRLPQLRHKSKSN
ncbi:hypothetical protein PRIPAC_86546 [Pristionchus pacificus]|uniref:Uncharacterized protein n=1 Tax=Pristionchus pacificus TaxID=54126 RepID=A0A2A6BNT0_PRIPA|nr:hypothetical protein PRIPAC_86546 [Pristionchus pacificus]|eukprot:PDM67567.1 hypothetical protein PRIPAC_48984 [Pristionchus pacificus]